MTRDYYEILKEILETLEDIKYELESIIGVMNK